MDYVRQKAKLMAQRKMSGGNKPSRKIQVMKVKVGKERGSRLDKSLESQVL